MEEFRGGHRSGATPPSRVARPPASSGTKPPTVTQLLTDDEHQAVQMLGEVANMMGRIIGDGLTRRGDIAEAVHHVHNLQRMILAQAAARAYPAQYRLMGDIPHPDGAVSDG